MTHKFLFLIAFLAILSNHSGASEAEISTISFGPVQLAENRLEIKGENIGIKANISGLQYLIKIKTKTVQWVRMSKILLMPRVEIALLFKAKAKNITVRYQNRSILFQSVKKRAHAQFFVSLFKTDAIEVFHKGEKVGNIKFELRNSDKQKNTHLIDYSCAPYKLDIKGLDGEFLSAGCFLSRRGHFGKEKGNLEIYWTSPNYRLLDQSKPPYVINLRDRHPVYTTIQNIHTGKRRVIRMNARVPKRLPRLKTAIGFGPYEFETQTTLSASGKSWTSPIMLYGNFHLTDESSFRFFDAFVMKKSYFNNFGFYFAYDVGSAFDKRIKLIPLLGFQSVRFHHAPDKRTFNSLIYPQGFEFIYKHAFGLKNYSLVYGMFFSTKDDEDYDNLWIRFGRKVFLEINFLSFKERDNYARTWGLSVGLPLVSFF